MTTKTVDAERQAFEACYKDITGSAEGMIRRKAYPGMYMDDTWNAAWLGWQARAALAATPDLPADPDKPQALDGLTGYVAGIIAANERAHGIKGEVAP